jgi:hypothetical protein
MPDGSHGEDLGRGRRATVRVLALLGTASYSLMLCLVAAEAAGVITSSPVGSPDDPPPSPAALAGAAAPGELVHLVGSLGALALGASGLLALVLRPGPGSAARQVLAASSAMLAATFLAGNPDNVGGQAGAVDPAFLVLVVPPLLAAVVAGPVRGTGGRHPALPLGVLAVVALPVAGWWGVGQALTQRSTFPPTADPHHQAHWFAMAVLAFAVVLVVLAAACGGAGWRLGATVAAVTGMAFGAASLVDADAASAAPPPVAAAAVAWAAAVLVATWRPRWLPGYGRSATSSATGLRTPV